MGYWDMSTDDYFNYLGDQKTGLEKIQGGAKKFGDTLSLLEQAGTPFGASQSSLIAPPSNSMGVAQSEWDFLNPVSGPQSAGGPVSPPPFQQSGILQGAINRQGAADDLGIAQQQAINQSTAESILNRRDGLLGSNTVFGGATPQAPQAPQAPQSLIDKILHRFGPAGQGISKFISPVTGAMGDFADWGREQALAGNLSALAPEFSAGVRQAEDARIKAEDAQSMQNYRTGMLEVNQERNRLAAKPPPKEITRSVPFTQEDDTLYGTSGRGGYWEEKLVNNIVVSRTPKVFGSGQNIDINTAKSAEAGLQEIWLDEYKQELNSIRANNDIVDRLVVARDLINEGQIETGKFSSMILPLQAWGLEFGIGDPEDVGSKQFLESLFQYVVPRMRVEGSGSTSDGEIKMFQLATAGMGNTTEANRLQTAFVIQTHEHNRKRNALKADMLKQGTYNPSSFEHIADLKLGQVINVVYDIEEQEELWSSIPKGDMYVSVDQNGNRTYKIR